MMMAKNNKILFLLGLFILLGCNDSRKLTSLPDVLTIEKNKNSKYSFLLKEDNELSVSTKVFVEDTNIVVLKDAEIEAVLKEKNKSVKVPHPDDYQLLLHMNLQGLNNSGQTKLFIQDSINAYKKELLIKVM